nr:uncharacterized protein LOC106782351 isoform X2 [Equus caballus]
MGKEWGRGSGPSRPKRPLGDVEHDAEFHVEGAPAAAPLAGRKGPGHHWDLPSPSWARTPGPEEQTTPLFKCGSGTAAVPGTRRTGLPPRHRPLATRVVIGPSSPLGPRPELPIGHDTEHAPSDVRAGAGLAELAFSGSILGQVPAAPEIAVVPPFQNGMPPLVQRQLHSL